MDSTEAYPSGCTTEPSVNTFVYTWTLKRFKCLCEGAKVGEYLESIPFSSGPADPKLWHLILYPSSDRDDSKGHIALYLFLKTSDKPIKARAKFCIVNTNKKNCYNATTSINQFLGDGSGYGFSKFIDLKQVLSQSSLLLVDGALILKIRVEIISDPVTRMIQPEIPIQVMESSMSDDFQKMFRNKSHADVKLFVGNNEFEAHKVFLMARSSVFRAMFEVEMKEKHENQVVISDTEPHVIKAMLNFIYTDDKPDFKSVPAEKLLPIADKYDLQRLKTMCEVDMCSRLHVNSLAEILVLADRHNCHQLKRKCLEFVKTNVIELAARDDCKETLRANENLIPDIVFSLLEES